MQSLMAEKNLKVRRQAPPLTNSVSKGHNKKAACAHGLKL